jgi:hypothetical protein
MVMREPNHVQQLLIYIAITLAFAVSFSVYAFLGAT